MNERPSKRAIANVVFDKTKAEEWVVFWEGRHPVVYERTIEAEGMETTVWMVVMDSRVQAVSPLGPWPAQRVKPSED